MNYRRQWGVFPTLRCTGLRCLNDAHLDTDNDRKKDVENLHVVKYKLPLLLYITRPQICEQLHKKDKRSDMRGQQLHLRAVPLQLAVQYCLGSKNPLTIISVCIRSSIAKLCIIGVFVEEI